MSKRILKSIYLFFILFLFGCANGSVDSETTFNNTILLKRGEIFEINKSDDLKLSLNTSYTTTDSEVAFLQQGKYIVANGVGKATIEVQYEGKKTLYEVKVSAAGDGDKGYIYDDRSDALGYGYNAFNGLDNDFCNWKNRIFDENIVNSDALLYISKGDGYKYKSYIGSTIEEYVNKLENSTYLKITVKLFRKTVYSNIKENHKDISSSNSKIESCGRLLWTNTREYHSISRPDSGYSHFLSSHVKNELLGIDEKNTSVEEFIKKYGTHIIVSCCVGDSYNFEYLSTAPIEEENILNFITKGHYIKLNKPATVSMSCRWTEDIAFGFGKHYSNHIDDKTFFMNFDIFRLSNTKNFIGPINEASLYPVWDLIDEIDGGKYKSRKEEFIKYMESRASE